MIFFHHKARISPVLMALLIAFLALQSRSPYFP